MADICDYDLDIPELGEITEEGSVKRFALNHFSPPPQSKSQRAK
jgi:ribonuclease BN (tRNA processing enzyme)